VQRSFIYIQSCEYMFKPYGNVWFVFEHDRVLVHVSGNVFLNFLITINIKIYQFFFHFLYHINNFLLLFKLKNSLQYNFFLFFYTIFFFTLYHIYHFLLILKLTTFTLLCTSTYQTKLMGMFGNALYRT
jgi:hypothetical protein